MSIPSRTVRLDRKQDRLEKKTDDGFKSVVDVLDMIRADVHDTKIAPGPAHSYAG
jgi:hypothetical protein